MADILHIPGNSAESLRGLLQDLSPPFTVGESVGIKIHWGERGNEGFLHPRYAREIVRWLTELGVRPFVFDTTVLYSGGRRSGEESLKTAAEHGFTEEYLGCPVRIGDGMTTWGPTPRRPEWTDMEWQLRRWLFLTWLSGDFITEMHVHNLDIMDWAMGSHPVQCAGL
ncbi:MAG: DUF362 domain-containing protein, partial [Thermodesulfobacteriota bacterium]